LATSDRTVGVIKQMLVAGESIDQRDNDKLNALALALRHNDLGAARRLIRLGAHPQAPVGMHDIERRRAAQAARARGEQKTREDKRAASTA
jgi:hypothetical protein